MGQTVVIRDHAVIGDVLLVTTDRSFTGQDGQAITPDEPGSAVPGLLASGVFGRDPEVDHVYVLQNTVSVRRRRPWDETAIGPTLDLISGFLRHYDEGEPA